MIGIAAAAETSGAEPQPGKTRTPVATLLGPVPKTVTLYLFNMPLLVFGLHSVTSIAEVHMP